MCGSSTCYALVSLLTSLGVRVVWLCGCVLVGELAVCDVCRLLLCVRVDPAVVTPAPVSYAGLFLATFLAENEIAICASIRPAQNVVQLFGFCVDAPDGDARIVMELCTHGNLSDHVRRLPNVTPRVSRRQWVDWIDFVLCGVWVCDAVVVCFACS